jgi:hypothetical protein
MSLLETAAVVTGFDRNAHRIYFWQTQGALQIDLMFAKPLHEAVTEGADWFQAPASGIHCS